MMKEVKIEKCPYCGGEEFIDCRAESYGGVYLSTGVLRGAALYATVCRDCGSIVRNYCKEPEKLYPKKQRRS
ncbi:MAG: hypothetical protein K2J30_05145 [Clostridia bacterium]|nr:hypothetical protein [Clostridia bacterium]